MIKPALVGLAGPWISGGVEFNWPQHHRPATFLPVDGHRERARRRSGHRLVLRPRPVQPDEGHARRPAATRAAPVIELQVRLLQPHGDVQTFLWWANVAARVHDDYQSFFPPDVLVADHAKRATTTFPLRDRPYYGVDYPARAADLASPISADADRLDWYPNIPVPTSYMCAGHERRLLRRLRPPARGRLRALGRPPHRAGEEAVDLGQSRRSARPGTATSPTTTGRTSS